MLQNHNQLGRIASADEFIFFCPAQQPLAILVLFLYPRERNSGKGSVFQVDLHAPARIIQSLD